MASLAAGHRAGALIGMVLDAPAALAPVTVAPCRSCRALHPCRRWRPVTVPVR
jgi:hypothetical protein